MYVTLHVTMVKRYMYYCIKDLHSSNLSNNLLIIMNGNLLFYKLWLSAEHRRQACI